MEPGFHGPHGPIDSQGDLFVGQVVFMEEQKDLAILGSELIDSALQFAREVVGVGEACRRIGCLDDDFDRGHLSRLSGQGGSATVRGDSQEPGPDRAIAVESR